MNKIIFTLSIFLSAFFGYWLGNHRGDAKKLETNPAFNEDERSRLLERIYQLTAENKKLSAENNFIAQSSSLQTNPKIAAVESVNQPGSPIQSNPTDQSVENIAKEEYELNEGSSSFYRWFEKNQKEKPWFNLGMEMEGRFESEEKNFAWANEEENQIQTLFSQEQSLSGIALKSASCKTTQCQLKVGVTDLEQANEVAMEISKILGNKKFSQVIVDSRIKQGETILYVTRNPKGFEFN